jgi:hypothetical protein
VYNFREKEAGTLSLIKVYFYSADDILRLPNTSLKRQNKSIHITLVLSAPSSMHSLFIVPIGNLKIALG